MVFLLLHRLAQSHRLSRHKAGTVRPLPMPVLLSACFRDKMTLEFLSRSKLVAVGCSTHLTAFIFALWLPIHPHIEDPRQTVCKVLEPLPRTEHVEGHPPFFLTVHVMIRAFHSLFSRTATHTSAPPVSSCVRDCKANSSSNAAMRSCICFGMFSHFTCSMLKTFFPVCPPSQC